MASAAPLGVQGLLKPRQGSESAPFPGATLDKLAIHYDVATALSVGVWMLFSSAADKAKERFLPKKDAENAAGDPVQPKAQPKIKPETLQTFLLVCFLCFFWWQWFTVAIELFSADLEFADEARYYALTMLHATPLLRPSLLGASEYLARELVENEQDDSLRHRIAYFLPFPLLLLFALQVITGVWSCIPGFPVVLVHLLIVAAFFGPVMYLDGFTPVFFVKYCVAISAVLATCQTLYLQNLDPETEGDFGARWEHTFLSFFTDIDIGISLDALDGLKMPGVPAIVLPEFPSFDFSVPDLPRIHGLCWLFLPLAKLIELIPAGLVACGVCVTSEVRGAARALQAGVDGAREIGAAVGDAATAAKKIPDHAAALQHHFSGEI